MFFIVSKILGFFAIPSNLLIVLALSLSGLISPGPAINTTPIASVVSI